MELALEWHDRRIVGSGQSPRRFLDFVVDGESLYERHDADFVGCLGWLPQKQDDAAAARLLRREPPDVDGRVSLYICPEDADPYCGMITAVVERIRSEVVWRSMALSGFDWHKGRWTHQEEAFQSWPDFKFDANRYWRVITNRPRPEGPVAER